MFTVGCFGLPVVLFGDKLLPVAEEGVIGGKGFAGDWFGFPASVFAVGCCCLPVEVASVWGD